MLYGPTKATWKNEVFLDFCLFVLSPKAFILVIIETPTRCPSTPKGLYLLHKNLFAHKISGWCFNSFFTLEDKIFDEIS